MFTGIIETTAKVLKKSDNGITVARPPKFTELQTGQSIAVNGACLSITRADHTGISFDVVPETFSKTNLAHAETVNLERAMPTERRFEGHLVLGHVDGTSRLILRTKEGNGERFTFETPEDLTPYFVQKGSVTVNGVSLTIAAVTADRFEIAVIPQTLAFTNLSGLQTGDAANIEADYFAKLLFKWHSEKS